MISEVDWVREKVRPSPTAAGSFEISPINWVNLDRQLINQPNDLVSLTHDLGIKSFYKFTPFVKKI